MSVTVSNSTGGLAAPFLGRTASLVGVPNLQAAQSLAIRVRWTVTTTTGNPLLIWVNDGSLAGMYIGRFSGSGANVVDFVRVSSGGPGNNAASTTGYGSTSAWVHLCMTYDGTNIVSYVDGVQAGTIASTPAFLPNQLPTQMACGGMGEAEMVDACFFNRALTAAEVAVIASGRLAPYRVNGCYSYFPMFAQTSALSDCGIDYGASGNNCTLQLSGTGNPVSSNGAPPTAWGTRANELILPLAKQIVATGTTNTTGTAALTSAASIPATGTTQTTGTAAMTAAAPLAASGTTQTTGTAALSSAASIPATGTTQTTGTASFSSVTFPIVATGLTQTTGSATVGNLLTATGTTQTTGSAAMTATFVITATGLTQTSGTANVSSSAGGGGSIVIAPPGGDRRGSIVFGGRRRLR